MARRIVERNFDPAQPVYARRKFTANGHHFKVGAHFDWKRLAVDRRRVRQMFDAGKLRHPVSEVEPARESTTQVATENGPVDVRTPDELDDINDMRELREIAENEGAKTTTSKTLQRRYIRENRQA